MNETGIAMSSMIMRVGPRVTGLVKLGGGHVATTSGGGSLIVSYGKTGQVVAQVVVQYETQSRTPTDRSGRQTKTSGCWNNLYETVASSNLQYRLVVCTSTGVSIEEARSACAKA
jgi:hypothetical protein